ncbi:MAG: hypothetical protein ACR2PW_03910 [Gammaproteobacteria bacterium]
MSDRPPTDQDVLAQHKTQQSAESPHAHQLLETQHHLAQQRKTQRPILFYSIGGLIPIWLGLYAWYIYSISGNSGTPYTVLSVTSVTLMLLSTLPLMISRHYPTQPNAEDLGKKGTVAVDIKADY